MLSHIQAKLAIDSRDQLGEGPAWDAARGRLIWSDNAIGIIHEAKPDGAGGWRESRRWNLEGHFRDPVVIGSNRLGAAIPRANGGLIVAGGNEIFMLDESGRVTPFVRFDFDPMRVHMNDAKCDRQGRLWVGTSTPTFSPGHCVLYRVDPDGSVSTILERVTTSNGPDWSPDGLTFYYSDSPTQSVDAFDFDPVRGAIGNRRRVVFIDPSEGSPDGMTVDNEGCLWLAVVGVKGEVRRYAPDGTLLLRIKASTPMVTSCAFGGADGGDFFITSAAFLIPEEARRIIGLTAEEAKRLAAAPSAGGLFVCRPGTTGSPATPFAG